MEILDNINSLLGEDLKRTVTPGSRLKIAASCFSIYAYEALKSELEKIDTLEFVFTSPAFMPEEAVDKMKKERREFHIPKLERERNLSGGEFEIRLKNKLTQRAIARECAEWMKRKATFRSNRTAAPMQPFALVDGGHAKAAYMPLHGFTAVDLGYQKGNAVSNLVHKMEEAPVTQTYLSLFDQIWQSPDQVEDVTDRLTEHIAAVYQENSPERIYFLMLYHIFNEFLEDLNEDVLPNDRTGYLDSLIWKKLYNFQRDAATGVINKLETYNGCILADSVGLGKTFTALAVIKYYELRNKSVLVLCPKKLTDNWLTYNQPLTTNIFAADRFNYHVLCHTDLSRESGESLGIQLKKLNWGNFDLVVIDESHNFRNNAAFKDHETRYQKLLNKVIRAGVKTKVLMLSATPVNNRFNDLKNQLALAYEGNPELLASKLRPGMNIEGIFRRAQASFNAWSTLPPEQRTPEAILQSLDFDFFELLDSVTIARSRKHIQTFYDTREIGNFPERNRPLSYHCGLTSRPDVMGFNGIFTELSALTLSIYAPVQFILPSRLAKYADKYDTEGWRGGGRLRQTDREQGLLALMTVNLLKRLESSVEAFRITLAKLESSHRQTLERIEAFKRGGGGSEYILDRSDEFAEVDLDSDDDDSPFDDDQIGKRVQVNLADMDIPAWERDLQADLTLIAALLKEMQKIKPAEDSKLQHLKTQIESKLASPLNRGNQKVLIFTAFADTADYLYAQLAPAFLKSHRLHSAKVTGSDRPKSTLDGRYDFLDILTLFSPISKEKDKTLPNEKGVIDILIGTDCISEGQNLQDCDYLINYDIHWNPVRIIQRFGRIDRLGSRNQRIQLVNYWPDISLDEYINLKARVEDRMVIADVTATGDDNVLYSQANDLGYRKEQLRRLQQGEVIEMEDVKTGVSITDLGLNDFRMDLLRYVKEHGEIAALPTGLHAVIPADIARGLHPGVLFALRNRHPAINIGHANRLHPYYLVYIGKDGKPVTGHVDVKRILDLLSLACKDRDAPIPEAYRPFNQSTQDGKDMSVYSQHLEEAVRSIIAVKEEKDLDSLFSSGPTTALAQGISGLDDFELLAFLVVQESA